MLTAVTFARRLAGPAASRLALTTLATAAILLTASHGSARATTVTDLPNDILGTFNVPGVNPLTATDLDLTSASLSFSGTTMHMSATAVGNIGQTANTTYVFGINRGTNNPRFGAFNPGILFDAVVFITPGGTSSLHDLINPANNINLPSNQFSISGNTISLDIEEAQLASQGFAFDQFTLDVWSRVGLVGNNTIADFAPDDANFAVAEPASLALFGLPLAGMAWFRRQNGAPQRA